MTLNHTDHRQVPKFPTIPSSQGFGAAGPSGLPRTGAARQSLVPIPRKQARASVSVVATGAQGFQPMVMPPVKQEPAPGTMGLTLTEVEFEQKVHSMARSTHYVNLLCLYYRSPKLLKRKSTGECKSWSDNDKLRRPERGYQWNESLHSVQLRLRIGRASVTVAMTATIENEAAVSLVRRRTDDIDKQSRNPSRLGRSRYRSPYQPGFLHRFSRGIRNLIPK